MKFYITPCFLFLVLTVAKADDLTFNVKNTIKGGTTGSIDLTISGGTSPYLISWAGPNGFTSKTEDIDNLAVGTYTLTVTDNYCGTASATVTVKDFLTGIEEFNEVSVRMFPNPALTEVQLSLPEFFKNYQLKIVNILGDVLVEQHNLTPSSLTLDVGFLTPGIYFIELMHEDKLVRKKLIKI